MVQLLITIGLCVGFFCCYGTAPIPSSLSWRLPFALQSGIAIALAIAAHVCLPHSPRWLAYKGRKEEASRVWDKLGVSDAEREKDILQNPTLNDATPLTEGIALPNESVVTPQPNPKLSFKARLNLAMDRLRNSFGQDTRKPMVLGIFLMSMQQLSGIDGVIYVSRLRSSFQPPSLSTPVTYTINQPTVRPSPILPSRPRLKLHLSCVRHLRHPDFRLHHRIRHLRRQMGSSLLYHLRRPRAALVHGHHRLPICNRQRARHVWSRQMGCHSSYLYLRCGLFDE